MSQMAQYPDGEVYTIGQAAESTGVPADTIRSWERRHGVPKPVRTPSGQRLYSSQDLGLIAIIQEQRERGRTMDQAIRDALRGKREASPAARLAGVEDSIEGSAFAAKRILDAVSRLDLAEAQSVAGTAVWALGPGALALDVLYPALQALERRELQGMLRAGYGRAGRAWLRRKLAACLDGLSPEARGGQSALVAGVHDEAGESLGVAITCCLADAGLAATFGGSGHNVADVEGVLTARRPNVLVLVAQSPAATIVARSIAARVTAGTSAAAWSGIAFAAGFDTVEARGVAPLPLSARQVIAAVRGAIDGERERPGRTGNP